MQDRLEHWARVKEVLDLALQTAITDRHAFVREACGGEIELERDVESLLQYSDQTAKLDDCVEHTLRGLTLSTAAPQQIGPYRIDRVLGHGGMATVET